MAWCPFAWRGEVIALTHVPTDYRVVDTAPVRHRRRLGRGVLVRASNGRIFELRQEKGRTGITWRPLAPRPDPLPGGE